MENCQYSCIVSLLLKPTALKMAGISVLIIIRQSLRTRTILGKGHTPVTKYKLAQLSRYFSTVDTVEMD